MSEAGDSAIRELEAAQLARLERLLSEVLATNPFYRNRIGRESPVPGSLEEFVEVFPPTTKAEWGKDQIVHPPYGTNLTYPIESYIRCHQTSGTSGRPMRWLDTRESWDSIVDDWVVVLRKAGLTSADRFFFAFSFGPFLGFWSAFEAAVRLGGCSLPGGGMSTETRLRVMRENDITVLVCTPTYAMHMGEVAAHCGMRVGDWPLRCILVAGEPGGSLHSTRERLAALWPDVRVFDHHGMTETGPVTYQCPRCPGLLHCIDTSCLAEVNHPGTGRPVRPGERGELVLTTLNRTGSPLIRYRTGDMVELAPRGECGCPREKMTFKGGIIGRYDDMVVIRGVNVYPSAVDEIVRQSGGIAEYRVETNRERSLAELIVRVEVVPGHPDPGAAVRDLEGRFRRRLGLRIPVRQLPPDTLPRFEMKARRWVRR